jgi:hypothetical protein
VNCPHAQQELEIGVRTLHAWRFRARCLMIRAAMAKVPNLVERGLLRVGARTAPILDLIDAATFRSVATALDLGLFEAARGAATRRPRDRGAARGES